MCFSASASFIASGGLAVLGGTTFAIAKKEDKLLAVIPIIFSIQQFCEGIQWVYINSGSMSLFFGYVFLFFAFIFWPIYIPVTVFVLDKKERKILAWFMFVGILVALYFLITLVTGFLDVKKLNSCISYTFNFPYKDFVVLAYLAAVIGSLCVSGLKVFRYFGIIAGFLGLVSYLFFVVAFTSIWCFFAAIVSMMFFVYVKYKRKTNMLLDKMEKKIMKK